MKKSLLLAVIIFAASACSYLPYKEMTFSLKYDIFTERGIYVSPFPDDSQSYEFIGEFGIEFYSGAKGSQEGDYVIISGGDSSYYKPEIFQPDSNYVMNKFAELAEANGADAIFNLKCLKTQYIQNSPDYYKYTISGVFAKRK